MLSKKKNRRNAPGDEDLRLNPEQRIAANFDETSIARFPIAKPGEMGFRVLDYCAEENIK